MSLQSVVQIADMKMMQRKGELITFALGSCIGISIYDPMVKLGALIHIMLPEAQKADEVNPFKFADLGIATTLKLMEMRGGSKQRYICKIAGGATMFGGVGGGRVSNIGERNYHSVCNELRRNGINIHAKDVGGSNARTMVLDVETGNVLLRSIQAPEKYL